MSLEGLQLGHYRLLSRIGRGGSSEVYLSQDTGISRQVAVKVLQIDISPYPTSDIAKQATHLFEREAKAIAQLDHPHILPLYDYGEETINGITYNYLVTPYRQEGSLAAWLGRRSGMLTVADVEYFITLAAGALQYAHDQHIIHRDIKPSNFLIRNNVANPDRPDLLLADFGLARAAMASSNASQTVVGTPTYMAPEQWEGHPVPATDHVPAF